MAAADEQLILAGGTLYADGTALGTVQTLALEYVGFQDPIIAEEWGGETCDMVFLREEFVVTAVLATPTDTDALAAGFPNVSGSQIQIPGSHVYGTLQSNKAVDLTIVPLNPGTNPAFRVREAIPLMQRTLMPFNAQDPMYVEVSWLGIRNSNGLTAEAGVGVASLQAILGASLLAEWDSSVSGSITSDANGISQWSDIVGSYHLTQGTNANKPNVASAAFNGLDAVQYVYANQEWLGRGSAPVPSGSFHLFLVMAVDDLGPSYVLYPWGQWQDNNNRLTLNPQTAAELVGLDVVSGGATTQTGFPAYVAGDATLVEISNVSNVYTMIVNGTAHAQTASANPGTASEFALGSYRNAAPGVNAFGGYLMHAGVYNGTPTAAQLSAMRSTLAAKWGITL